MEYNSHYVSKRSFCFAVGIAVVLIVISMVTCLVASSMRGDSLKDEILNSVNSAVAAKTEANNSLILQYLSAMTSASPSEPEFLYQVREHNGKIAVISTDGNVVQILDVYVFTLPDNDKSQLADGIPLYSETELLSIIQDYTS